MKKVGFIGGSGLYQMSDVVIKKNHKIKTPYGQPSDEIIEVDHDGKSFYFLPRHGRGHKLTPSEVNYRANIFALKKLGVDKIVSVSAVGSLRDELPPGTFFLPDQFIDWTKGVRKRTFFGEGIVGHVSVAHPVSSKLQTLLEKALMNEKIHYKKEGSYICIEGPQFSSKAESEIYRSFGASVVGMTNVPEAYLAKEAGMAYATVAMVTDYDCWRDEHCTLEEIIKVMTENTKRGQKLILNFMEKFENFQVEKENQNAIISKQEDLSKEQKETLETLLA